MLRGQAAAGAYLRLEAGRQGDEKARRDEGPLQRTEGDGRVQAGPQVHAGGKEGRIGRQRLAGLVDDVDFGHTISGR